MNELWDKINQLEYHQRLLMKLIEPKGHEFYQMIIEKNLQEKEVEEFHQLCDELSKKLKEQKADKFVFYAPLFKEFLGRLNKKLDPVEVIEACMKQNIHPELMNILKSNL